MKNTFVLSFTFALRFSADGMSRTFKALIREL